MAWNDWATAPRDGRWIIALARDGLAVHRVSWGCSRGGELAWCSADRRFEAEAFIGWINWPNQPGLDLRDAVVHRYEHGGARVLRELPSGGTDVVIDVYSEHPDHPARRRELILEMLGLARG